MFEALHVVQTLVAPVVVISANGLLCLALYNRMSVVIGRARTINKERFDLIASVASTDNELAEPLVARIHTLDELGHQLYDRAKLIRGSLLCLMATVLFMLLCSLALGLEPLWAPLGITALGLFVLGIAVMMVGVLFAMRELQIALDPLLFEHDRLEESQNGG